LLCSDIVNSYMLVASRFACFSPILALRIVHPCLWPLRRERSSWFYCQQTTGMINCRSLMALSGWPLVEDRLANSPSFNNSLNRISPSSLQVRLDPGGPSFYFIYCHSPRRAAHLLSPWPPREVPSHPGGRPESPASFEITAMCLY